MNDPQPDLIPAPQLDYQPQDPRDYRPSIGLIGCGGISKHHLSAYRKAGYDVVAMCDINLQRAQQRRDEYYPDAKVYLEYEELLEQDDIEVVDIATHPDGRSQIIEAALEARKHILCQKPFVADLDEGERLVDLADSRQVKLAVNQNGRWAPHFSYMRKAVEQGLLGPLAAVHLSVHWDHTWVEGTPFADIRDLILFDYAIHWFDMINCLFSDRAALRLIASTTRTAWQTLQPSLLAHALIEFPHAHATLTFDANTAFGSQDRSFVMGQAGTISSVGPGNRIQTLRLTTAEGTCEPKLVGSWFSDGFHGTMGELLCSIEDNRPTTIDARGNLDSLALCFAAVASAKSGEFIRPGAVRRLH